MTDQTGADTGAGTGGAASGEGEGAGKTNDTILNGAGEGGQQQTQNGQEGAQAGQGEGDKKPGEGGQQQPDWRDLIAGEDKQFRKQLERYADLPAIGKKLRSLEQRLSSGEYKKSLPENPTEEDLKAYRKENGIPEKPEGYLEKLALPNGVVLGEADKPVAESFAKRAFERNWTPQQYNDAVSWYYENLEAQQAAQQEADDKFKEASLDELRNVWQGPDYKRNLNAVNNFLAGWPEDVKVAVLAARDPDGRKLGDNPAFVRQLAALARELNPAATLVPAGSDGGLKGISDRIADIEKMMGDRSSDYWRGPKSAALQQEIRELYEARDKIKARAA